MGAPPKVIPRYAYDKYTIRAMDLFSQPKVEKITSEQVVVSWPAGVRGAQTSVTLVSDSPPSPCCGPLIQFLLLGRTPTITLLSLLLRSCKFSTVMNLDVNICYAGCPICDPCERSVNLQRGLHPQVENCWFRAIPAHFPTMSLSES